MISSPLDIVRTMAGMGSLGNVLDLECLKLVSVEPMPQEMLSEIEDLVVPRACYNNSFFVTEFFGSRKKARYCVGYAGSFVPISHAWVWVDGNYYDPTWQVHTKIGAFYVPFFELEGEELMEVVIANDFRPPEPWEVAFIGQKKNLFQGDRHAQIFGHTP